MSKTFISWSGDSGRRVAALLKELLSWPGMEAWVSSQDVEAGRPWLEEIEIALRSSDYAIACLTPTTSVSPWINFEAGFTFARLNRLFVLTVGEELTSNHPFRVLQVLDGRKREDLTTLITALGSSAKFADQWLKSQYAAWDTGVEKTLGRTPEFEAVAAALQSIQNAARKLETNTGIFANTAFRNVIKQSLDEICTQLDGVVSAYSVPADRYPIYLAALQNSPESTVNAIALVELEEFFWTGQLGKRILDSTRTKDSERVFVLKTSRQFLDFMPTLLAHARKYQVYVLPLLVLTKELDQYCRDFSLIDVAGDKVLATYVEDGYFRNIKFSTSKDKIREHQQAFATIRDLAFRIDGPHHADNEEELLNLWARAESSLSELDRRTVEMSKYIPIHDYDRYEERHAYYIEMMQKMLDLLPVPKQENGLRVLELGAGTGIFTKRLAALDSVAEIVAIEYDWACCQTLKHNVREFQKKVRIEYEDSRVFNPAGKFDAIVSSFADHHIRPGDKGRYFENVIRNLKKGAPFIVGDEFLREHGINDEASRIAALHDYHEHIINIALKQNETVLAELEREALKSGIERKGDFKLSCGHYEEMLGRASFQFQRYCIGPLDTNQIGGVFVYSMVRAQPSEMSSAATA